MFARVFQGLANPFQAARYHSLVIDKETCPEDLEVTAWTEDGTIMAVRHKKFPKLQVKKQHLYDDTVMKALPGINLVLGSYALPRGL